MTTDLHQAPGHSGDDTYAGSRTSKDSMRRCIASRRVVPKRALLRFVVGPDERVVPDIAECLPGRGLWLSATRPMMDLARARGAFQSAAKRAVAVDPDLADEVERQLAERALAYLGFARRAGEVSTGRDAVRRTLATGCAGVLVQAADGAPDGRARMRAVAGATPTVELFTGAELSAALGRDNVVHAVVKKGRLTERFLRESTRLAGFRPVGESRFSFGIATSAGAGAA